VHQPGVRASSYPENHALSHPSFCSPAEISLVNLRLPRDFGEHRPAVAQVVGVNLPFPSPNDLAHFLLWNRQAANYLHRASDKVIR
jgi:hypothetical protein